MNEPKELLCRNCKKQLGKFKVCVGEIKCPRCKQTYEYQYMSEAFLYSIRHESIVEN